MKQVAFAYSFQGASHRRKEAKNESLGRKFPCQDRAFAGEFESSEIEEKKEVELFIKDNSSSLSPVMLPVELNPHELSFSVACVSDGHGGAKYFRSQRGAEFAVQTAIELLSTSIDKIAVVLEEKNLAQLNENLSKSFVRRWRRKVMKDFAETDKTEMERQLDDLKENDENAWEIYQADLEQAYRLAEDYEETENNPVESTEQQKQELKALAEEFSKLEIKSMYGCTVAVYFKIKDSPLWYAFKVGDSDILLSFDGKFVKPIADDPNCVDNVTTSLCNDDAVKHFCFPGEEYLGNTPQTIFCSSDGIANSFSNEEFLQKFYSQLQFAFDEDGPDKAKEEIQDALPKLSERGSGDDVSLAGIVSYDDSKEAKNNRQKTVLEKAKQHCENGEFDQIELLFKPYLDRDEFSFKYWLAFYEYKRIESLKANAEGLGDEFLLPWRKAIEKIKVVADAIPRQQKTPYVERIQKNINAMNTHLKKLLYRLVEKEFQ